MDGEGIQATSLNDSCALCLYTTLAFKLTRGNSATLCTTVLAFNTYVSVLLGIFF